MKAVLVLIFLCLSVGVMAQKKKPVSAPKPSVTVVENAKLYESGDVTVNVTGNSTPTVRLGLAQGAFISVEFPSEDRIFAIHPGDPDLVTFDETFAQKKYHFAVFRPGSNFVAPDKGHGPQTTIGVQMDSGLFVIFVIYPVKNVSENAHRCAISYKRDVIVGQRRAAGLQTDLIDGMPKDVAVPPKKDPVRSTIVTPSVEPPATPAQPIPDPQLKPVPAPPASRIKEPAKSAPEPQPEPTQKSALGDAWTGAKDEKKGFGWFGLKKGKAKEKEVEQGIKVLDQPVTETVMAGSSSGRPTYSAGGHGLQATVWEGQGTPETMVVLVEVKNISAKGLKLMADHPEVSVETIGQRARRLNIEAVVGKQIKGVPTDFWLNAGVSALMEVRFARPTIGVSQRLVVSVGHTLAADAPVNIYLTNVSK